MKFLIKNILVFSLLTVIIFPVFVNAQTTQPPIIPDCGVTKAGGGVNRECGYGDLLKLVNNIIKWIIMISVPVAAGVFAWAGFTLMTSGDNSSKRSEAKAMLVKVVIGFVVILAAWIIVTTITNALLSDGSNNGGTNFKSAVPVEGVK